jgi:hypothetical protein
MKIIETVLHPWIQEPGAVVSTKDNWKWLRVYKKNSEGVLRTKMQNNMEQPEVYEFACHLPTGDLYFRDAAATVSYKALNLLLANPINMAARIIFNVCKIPVHYVQYLFTSISGFFQKLQDRSCWNAFYENYEDRVKWLIDALCDDLEGIIAAVWYGVGMEIACFFAWTIDPFKGRSIVSQIERKWHKGAHFSSDCRFQCIAPEKKKQPQNFFMALCYQKRGNIYETVKDDQDDQYKYCILEQHDRYSDFAKLGIDMEVYVPCFPIIPPLLHQKC